MHNTYDLHDIVLGDGVKTLSFEINTHYLELCDHEEASSMWFVAYEETENYEFYRHEQHMLKDVTFCVPKSLLLHGLEEPMMKVLCCMDFPLELTWNMKHSSVLVDVLCIKGINLKILFMV